MIRIYIDRYMATSASSPVVVAATQFSCSEDMRENISKAKHYIREAASAGANIILLQELFATPYFCQEPSEVCYLGTI